MNLSVLGIGNIGGTIGQAWLSKGYDVMFGVRDPQSSKVRQYLTKNSGARAGSIAEACQFGDIILIAIPGSSVQGVVQNYQADLNGKTIIDATNQRGPHEVHNMTFMSENLPESNLFRAFSNLGWENFADPNYDGEKPDLFFCGTAENESTIAELIAAVGFRPIYLGGVDKTPLVDNLTMLWFTLAYERQYGRHIAFRLLTSE